VAGGIRTHNCPAHNQIPDPPGFGHGMVQKGVRHRCAQHPPGRSGNGA